MEQRNSTLGSDAARREFAQFLKTRRARLAPAEAGFHVGRRRRLSGLRREEVAVLAHVSEAWYARLEQGQPVAASPAVLDNIARALQLDSAERNYLFALARSTGTSCATAPTVSAAVAQMVDAMPYAPAVIYAPTWDILKSNAAYETVFGRIQEQPLLRGNVVRQVFLEPARRIFFPQWELVARRLLQAFRLSVGPYLGDPAIALLIEELRDESPDFAAWWDARDVFGGADGRKLINHPEAGLIELDHATVSLTNEPPIRMIVYTAPPASESDRRLRALLGDRIKE